MSVAAAQVLVSDGLVDTDKIGAGNFFCTITQTKTTGLAQSEQRALQCRRRSVSDAWACRKAGAGLSIGVEADVHSTTCVSFCLHRGAAEQVEGNGE